MEPEIKVDRVKWQYAAEMLNIGIFTINEVRSYLGLTPFSHGNVLAKRA